MEPIAEECTSPLASAFQGGPSPAAPAPEFSPLQTLTSGQRRPLRGGALQAHVCVVASHQHVAQVLAAFQQSDNFSTVVSWSYAYRIGEGAAGELREVSEDGLDEGVGEKLLTLLRRLALQGLLLVVGRWQDYGATPGLELYGTPLYSIVHERANDLIVNLKQAMGLMAAARAPDRSAVAQDVPRRGHFDLCAFPALPEPRPPTKYGPNHFLSDSPLNRPVTLPNLFSGGDPRMWMANDQALRQLPDAELCGLRSLRQPDWRIEEVLQAVAVLRGQPIRPAQNALARWGQCKEVLRSPTLKTELLLFDAAQVPAAAASAALTLLEGLDPEEIRRASPAAAALYDWARGVVRWRLEGPPRPGAEQPSACAAAGALMLRPPSQGGGARRGGRGESALGGSMRRVKSMPGGTLGKHGCAGFSSAAAKQRVGSCIDVALSR